MILQLKAKHFKNGFDNPFDCPVALAGNEQLIQKGEYSSEGVDLLLIKSEMRKTSRTYSHAKYTNYLHDRDFAASIGKDPETVIREIELNLVEQQ
jgi:hypothetical protein